jgi:(p)ppGpp synthase/HD superfamily hydrolase
VSFIPQTNLQLYRQLVRLDYEPADIDAVGKAYELGIRIFAGVYRGSGKPFLAHLVGTASILADQRARGQVVAAGLLHAAYTHGEFGNGWRGLSLPKRAEVRRAVGEEIEELVARYTELRWDARTIASLRERVDVMTPPERDVLLIRLANELEDHVDLGILYLGDADRRLEYMRVHLRDCVAMASRLGHADLASRLATAFDEVASAELPATLKRSDAESFRIAPASHRLRLRVLVSHFLVGQRWR